jgi:hypothetical protein
MARQSRQEPPRDRRQYRPPGQPSAREERRQEVIAEAVERIVPKRQLKLDEGDICIGGASAALKGATAHQIYALSEEGHGPLAGRYTTFEHAVAAGDDLARQRRVRLFYCEVTGGPAQLLRDYRGR